MTRLLTILTLILYLLNKVSASEELQCAKGIETPGTTLPRGDIPLLHGKDSLKILCLLDPAKTSLNSTRLHFYRGNDRVDPAFETVINDTAIELLVPKPELSNDMYYCKLFPEDDDKKALAVCLNKVIVGTKPQEVPDFECISLNWENFTCTWTPPHNYLHTSYSLMYMMPGRSGRGSFFGCPGEGPKSPLEKPSKLQCHWDLATDPHYRQAHQLFNFNLTGSNVFGRLSQQFKVRHYARVKPNRPHRLKAENNRTADFALIRWTVPYPLENFPPGLVHKIYYKSEYDEDWTNAVAVQNETKPHSWYSLLESLPYPYTWYDVRVKSMSAAIKEDDPPLWSDFAAVTFRTLGRKPDRPPEVPAGAFEVTPSLLDRDVVLYWKQLYSWEKNDENLTYVVRLTVNGTDHPLSSAETVKGHLSLYRLPLKRLDFTVSSKNSHGESELRSFISVPDQDDLVPEPVSFTKIEFGDSIYELSWKPPSRPRVRIDNYTLFWCDNARDRPYQCDGRLEWEIVPASLNIRNVTVRDDKIYQFAISAGGMNTDSGMVWASCTVIPNKVVGKMKNIWINRVGATYIEVGWKLECSDRIGVVDGYRIFYCPIVNPHNRDCKEPVQNVTITRDPSAIHSNVTDLKPYTTYAIRIAVITRHGDGLQSDALYNTTLEGPPSPPRDVRISDVSDTKMLVSWNEPLLKNGVLRYYKVNYDAGLDNLRSEKVEKELGYTEVLLRNLTSYTNYTITVEACSVSCSRFSEPIVLRTAIGRPGRISKPIVQFRNNSHMAYLSWNLPDVPGGTVDLYEVKVVQRTSDGNNVTNIYKTTQRELLIPETVCKTEGTQIYYYSVRAVNNDSSEDHGAAAFIQSESVTLAKRPPGDVNTVVYHGQWSPPTDNMCYTSRESNRVIILIVSLVFLVILIPCIFLGMKRLWLQYKEMQDIGVSLPPGLDVAPEKDPKYLFNNLSGPTKHIKDHEKSLLTPSADEISLLPNRNLSHGNGIKQGRDLSGFSVNTDSTTISLTSNRNSGDECKDIQEHSDDVNSDSTNSNNSSLRLRNVNCSSRPTSAAGDQINWNSNAKRNTPDDSVIPPYSAVGATFSQDFSNFDNTPHLNVLMMDNPTARMTSDSTPNGYVTIANIPSTVPKESANKTLSDSPSKYVKAAFDTNIEPAFVPVENGMDILSPSKSGYVSANHPMLTSKPYPFAMSNPQAQTSAENGYVKCDDPRFNPMKSPPSMSIIDFEKKSPNISKRISAPPLLHDKQFLDDRRISADYSKIQSLNLPKEHQFDDLDTMSPVESTVSPETYCRFGWDVNKPENQFDFSHNFADISALNSGDIESYDESLDDMMLNDQVPPNSNRPPAPHYFRLSNLPSDKQ